MTSSVKWPTFKRPLVAILRGVRPEETAGIVDALVEGGFEAIEIPLNSPEPFRSIEIAARRAPADRLIGAGTVLSTDEVGKLADAGGRLIDPHQSTRPFVSKLKLPRFQTASQLP